MKTYTVIDNLNASYVFDNEEDLSKVIEYFVYDLDFVNEEDLSLYSHYNRDIRTATDLTDIYELRLSYGEEDNFWFMEYEDDELIYDSEGCLI